MAIYLPNVCDASSINTCTDNRDGTVCFGARKVNHDDGVNILS